MRRPGPGHPELDRPLRFEVQQGAADRRGIEELDEAPGGPRSQGIRQG
jgi:hypothetical protein